MFKRHEIIIKRKAYMDKIIFEKELDELAERAEKVFSALKVCADFCLHNSDYAAGYILHDAEIRQNEVIEDIYNMQKKYLLMNEI